MISLKENKHIFWAVLFLLGTPSLSAQEYIVSFNYGHQFGTRLNYARNYLRLSEGDQYAGGLGLILGNKNIVDINYIGQTSELLMNDRSITQGEERVADMQIHMVQLGGIRYFNEGPIIPLLGGGMGLAFFNPKNENRELTNLRYRNSTEFFFSVRGGIRLMLNRSLGLSLQGDLLFPVQWGGLYISGGSGGVGGGVSLGTTTLVGSISGGVVLRI